MKPENRTIRALKKQLASASPEEAEAIIRVIASLNEVLFNVGRPAALKKSQGALAREVKNLAEVKKKKPKK